MLTPYQPRIVEKILTDRAGRRFRFLFRVEMVDGELRGELISVEQLYAHSVRLKKSCLLCLSAPRAARGASSAPALFSRPVVSPFFNKFQFFVSQPTRAPSRMRTVR